MAFLKNSLMFWNSVHTLEDIKHQTNESKAPQEHCGRASPPSQGQAAKHDNSTALSLALGISRESIEFGSDPLLLKNFSTKGKSVLELSQLTKELLELQAVRRCICSNMSCKEVEGNQGLKLASELQRCSQHLQAPNPQLCNRSHFKARHLHVHPLHHMNIPPTPRPCHLPHPPPPRSHILTRFPSVASPSSRFPNAHGQQQRHGTNLGKALRASAQLFWLSALIALFCAFFSPCVCSAKCPTFCYVLRLLHLVPGAWCCWLSQQGEAPAPSTLRLHVCKFPPPALRAHQPPTGVRIRVSGLKTPFPSRWKRALPISPDKDEWGCSDSKRSFPRWGCFHPWNLFYRKCSGSTKSQPLPWYMGRGRQVSRGDVHRPQTESNRRPQLEFLISCKWCWRRTGPCHTNDCSRDTPGPLRVIEYRCEPSNLKLGCSAAQQGPTSRQKAHHKAHNGGHAVQNLAWSGPRTCSNENQTREKSWELCMHLCTGSWKFSQLQSEQSGKLRIFLSALLWCFKCYKLPGQQIRWTQLNNSLWKLQRLWLYYFQACFSVVELLWVGQTRLHWQDLEGNPMENWSCRLSSILPSTRSLCIAACSTSLLLLGSLDSGLGRSLASRLSQYIVDSATELAWGR